MYHLIYLVYQFARFNSKRQEKIASFANIVSMLMNLSYGNHPMKHFAIPILCEFAHSTKKCRSLLLNDNGIDYFLRLLQDSFWSVNSLESIVALMKDDKKQTELNFSKPGKQEILASFVSACKADEKILIPIRRLMQESKQLTSFLNRSDVVKHFISFLNHPSPIIRLNSLQIINMLLLSVNNYTLFDEVYNLSKTLIEILVEEKAVLVADLAENILTTLTVK